MNADAAYVLAYSIIMLTTDLHSSQVGSTDSWNMLNHVNRYTKLRVAHALGMPGTFSPPPTSKEIAS